MAKSTPIQVRDEATSPPPLSDIEAQALLQRLAQQQQLELERDIKDADKEIMAILKRRRLRFSIQQFLTDDGRINARLGFIRDE